MRLEKTSGILECIPGLKLTSNADSHVCVFLYVEPMLGKPTHCLSAKSQTLFWFWASISVGCSEWPWTHSSVARGLWIHIFPALASAVAESVALCHQAPCYQLPYSHFSSLICVVCTLITVFTSKVLVRVKWMDTCAPLQKLCLNIFTCLWREATNHSSNL